MAHIYAISELHKVGPARRPIFAVPSLCCTEACPMPGFLVVLFPQHDPQAKVAGFMLTDRFVPFSCDFPYEKPEWYGTAILQGPAYFPDVAWFGGR